MSLGLRLMLLNGLVLVLVLGAFAGFAYLTQQQSLQRSLDASLQDQARVFKGNTSLWLDRARGRSRGVAFPSPQTFAAPDVFIQITGRDGEVMARSRSLNDQSLPSAPDELRRALDGEEFFADVDVDGQSLRMFVTPLRIPTPGEATSTGVLQVARPLGPLYGSLGILQTTFLSLGIVGGAVSLLAGWLLARAALRPIAQLTTAAHAIGAARDFRRRVPVPSSRRRDEIGRLTAEFNGMLGQLQAAYDQLEAANRQLEAALDAQRRFVADASHELRTPLTSLRGNVDLLRRMGAVDDPLAAPEEQEQLLADMAAETERLTRLVADLLLLAQADAGQHLPLAPTELGAVVQDAFRAARFLRPGIELQLGQVAPTWVAGDADRLKQLLLILLDNALKYTPLGGRVAIDAQPYERAGTAGVAIRVSDTGPGIPLEEQARIFARFYRGDPARRSDGVGLGLAIAHWIADEHHGALDLESAPGQGSTFTVWLPALTRTASSPPEPGDSPTRHPALVG